MTMSKCKAVSPRFISRASGGLAINCKRGRGTYCFTHKCEAEVETIESHNCASSTIKRENGEIARNKWEQHNKEDEFYQKKKKREKKRKNHCMWL